MNKLPYPEASKAIQAAALKAHDDGEVDDLLFHKIQFLNTPNTYYGIGAEIKCAYSRIARWSKKLMGADTDDRLKGIARQLESAARNLAAISFISSVIFSNNQGPA